MVNIIKAVGDYLYNVNAFMVIGVGVVILMLGITLHQTYKSLKN